MRNRNLKSGSKGREFALGTRKDERKSRAWGGKPSKENENRLPPSEVEAAFDEVGRFFADTPTGVPRKKKCAAPEKRRE